LADFEVLYPVFLLGSSKRRVALCRKLHPNLRVRRGVKTPEARKNDGTKPKEPRHIRRDNAQR
jgi:hypothetical protein